MPAGHVGKALAAPVVPPPGRREQRIFRNSAGSKARRGEGAGARGRTPVLWL
jgi:hypothetical protein